MKPSKNNIYFTKSERQGLYFIVFCILSIIIYKTIDNFTYTPTPTVFEDIELIPLKEFEESHTNEGLAADGNKEGSSNTGKLFRFDPNITPLDSLKMLPIPSKIAERIDNFRAKGAKYKDKESLKKVYGIAPYYKKIEPYIEIRESKNSQVKSTPQSQNSNLDFDQNQQEDLKKPESKFTSKIKKDSFIYDPNDYVNEEDPIIVELNDANIYQLMLVNGVGEYYAEKIMAFKVKTGGFHDVSQLKDVIKREELLEKVLPHFTCNDKLIRKRSINFIQKDSLGYIPGISFKKASIAVSFRANHYPIKGKEDLKKMKIFTDDEISLMMKYLNFDY